MSENQAIQRNIFRMVHIDNLKKILKEGEYSPSYRFDKDYINIGDELLISQRREFRVPIAPGGFLSDYIPFYFGGHSPMLLNIKTGYRGITQRPQRDIVFICAHIESIIKEGLEYVFTDGHAKDRLTSFYNRPEDLGSVNWSAVSRQYWKSTEENPDLMRQKQAEFLVKNHIPPICLSGIIVHDDESAIKVERMKEQVGSKLPVYIDRYYKYYYHD